MDAALERYIGAIPPQHKALFERLQRLILDAFPDVSPVISYGIPTYKLGRRRLFLAAWQHGVSIYGWGEDRDAGFAARHPELRSGKATIRVRPETAVDIPDAEFAELVRAALAG